MQSKKRQTGFPPLALLLSAGSTGQATGLGEAPRLCAGIDPVGPPHQPVQLHEIPGAYVCLAEQCLSGSAMSDLFYHDSNEF